jgi:hypothetical protein
MEGCPLLTHQGLRAVCDASFELRRPLLAALRTLRLTQSAGKWGVLHAFDSCTSRGVSMNVELLHQSFRYTELPSPLKTSQHVPEDWWHACRIVAGLWDSVGNTCGQVNVSVFNLCLQSGICNGGVAGLFFWLEPDRKGSWLSCASNNENTAHRLRRFEKAWHCHPLINTLIMRRLRKPSTDRDLPLPPWPVPPGARNNFAINIERLQYACPGLQELGLNGLGGQWGWEFNQTPARLPNYLPAPTCSPARGAAAAAGAAGAAIAGPSHASQAGGEGPAGAGDGEGGSSEPLGEAGGGEPGPGAAGPGASASGRPAPVGFASLRVCELGTTILHTDGKLSGRSRLQESALAR